MKGVKTLPGLQRPALPPESDEQRFDRMMRWLSDALRVQRAVPGVLVHRPMRFVWAVPPSLS